MTGSAYFMAATATAQETHTLVIEVDNEPGVLARVVGLFSGRGYNIESLTVSETQHAEHVSRITVVTTGTRNIIDQIKAQLERLVPVHKVVDLTETGRALERELMLIKVRGKGDERVEALRLADAFRARVVDATIETTAVLWQEAYELNVLSTVMCCKAVLPGMLARQQGAIVTLGSIAAHNGGTNAAHYAAAKGAVHTFTRALAKEVAPHVRVNAVAPGLIGTRFHDTFSTPAKRQATVAQTPLAREGTPGDVAAAVLFLASEAAGFLTGEIVEVNGGVGMF